MQTSDLAEVGVSSSLDEQVAQLAQLAKRSGLHGVVCSAHESARIASLCGDAFLKVTPGIRPGFAVANDQQRIMTPQEAMQAGSTHLVVGRPVTQAENPMDALAAIEAELGIEA